MLNVTLNDRTAKLLESYRRGKHLSREQAIEALLKEVTQRKTMQNALTTNWERLADQADSTFEADLNDIIKQNCKRQTQDTN